VLPCLDHIGYNEDLRVLASQIHLLLLLSFSVVLMVFRETFGPEFNGYGMRLRGEERGSEAHMKVKSLDHMMTDVAGDGQEH
jgi:hypothetical protein